MVKILRNKKAMDMFQDWAEIFFVILLVIGFLIAIVVKSKTTIYVIIFISGLIAGRMIFERQEKFSLPYVLIIFGFLIGFLIGVQVGDRKAIVLLYILGGLISYYVFDKGILHDLPF